MNHKRNANTRGFTLVELLVVMSIMIIMMALAVPSISKFKDARDVSQAVYEIAGLLEQARSYAMANNTYVFVGLTEVDSSVSASVTPQVSTGQSPYGRVAVAVVASKDGTRGYNVNIYNGTGDTSGNGSWMANYHNGANLVAIGKLQHFDNLHIADLGTPPPSGSMARPLASTAADISYVLGNPECIALTPFSWPLGTTLHAGQYYFQSVVNFDPQGVARMQSPSNVDDIAQWMEIGLQQTHGNLLPPKPSNQAIGNQAVIQIDCMTGEPHIYRP
jgi:prepilin-type N-terminal cleavage/methylation domain-containing protein